MSFIKSIYIVLAMVAGTGGAIAQVTVFDVVQDRERIADEHYKYGEYIPAIELYLNTLKRHPDNSQLLLKIARAYAAARDHESSIRYYNKFASAGNRMVVADLIKYGDEQMILRNYSGAEECYKKALQQEPANEAVSKRIWRLRNMQFIYEDSAHVSVRPLREVNTAASELCPVSFKRNLVFVSNRKNGRPVDRITDVAMAPFFSLYMIGKATDSALLTLSAGKPRKFAPQMQTSFNTGPVAFFQQQSKMVYIASSQVPAEDGSRSLGIYFGVREGDTWKSTGAFPYNDPVYSISSATINEEGTILYFSSDMKGGLGGKDLYMSNFVDGKWTKPQNLPEPVNTSGDEVFPFIHKNTTLYFSSNGHPGLGALDMFRSTALNNSFSEPENVGYPLNSNFDDFGLTFDSTLTHGYLTSNRQSKGSDDDLYEFDMDIQTYPLIVTGVLKFKHYSWSDAKEMTLGARSKMVVVDSWRNTTVFETTTGSDGSFELSIPYFSRYHILVTDDNGITHVAGLEIVKYRVDSGNYEVVVVKDLFAQQREQK